MKCSNYTKLFEKDYQKVFDENVILKKENKLLRDENRQLKLEIEKFKITQDKDCTCSSIPSSATKLKKGITNSRKPTGKKQGAIKGHKGTFLSKRKVDEIKENPKTKVIKKTINLTEKNKTCNPVKRYILGYEMIPVVYEIEIYPNEFGKYVIPHELKSQVSYAPEVKTLAMNLYYECNVSTDNITKFFNDLYKYKMSKGTIVNWTKELEKNFQPETGHILRQLQKEPYNHVDESQINVEGQTYNIHNVSSNKYTMQWVHKNKSHEAVEEIGFLVEYNGTLIKDGTHLYDKFSKSFVSCGAHINRYLIGANKGITHQGEENLLMFFKGLKSHRKTLIKKGYNSVTEKEYKDIYIQYKFLLDNWYKEIKKDQLINPLYDEERKLQARLLKDADQHLKFMTDFSLPFTNNRAETDIRCVKQRQKVGIFRNELSAERYVTIKSCLSTYKKNKINIFTAINSAFSKNTIII